jgi:hypothetical protein
MTEPASIAAAPHSGRMSNTKTANAEKTLSAFFIFSALFIFILLVFVSKALVA